MRFLLIICSAILLSGCAIREVGAYYPLSPYTVPTGSDDLPKDIFITIDGTGYSLSDRSNAGRMFELVDSRAGLRTDRATATYYAEGVGSGDFNPLGLVAGDGMGDDIKHAYDFLARTWQPGDDIYLNGFSRGAYGVRALAGFLYSAGLPDLRTYSSKQRRKIINDLFSAYKTSSKSDETIAAHNDRRANRIEAVWLEYGLRDHRDPAEDPLDRAAGYLSPASRVTIHAMSLWDTVAALGTPDGQEDPLEGPDHFLLTTCNVEYAFQALALDDNRSESFTPIIIDAPKMRNVCPAGAQNQQLPTETQEVWFSGAHSDASGTYIHNRMIDGAIHNVSFGWMIGNLSAISGGLLPSNAAAQDSRLSIIHDAQAGSPFGRNFRKPVAYRRHVYGADHQPVRLHTSVLDRLEFIFALDQWADRCGGVEVGDNNDEDKRPKLLCAEDLVTNGLVPELYAAGCLQAADWGYRLTPGREAECAQVIGRPRQWTANDLPLPECRRSQSEAYLTGTYYTGPLRDLQEQVIPIALPECVSNPLP